MIFLLFTNQSMNFIFDQRLFDDIAFRFVVVSRSAYSVYAINLSEFNA